jgi:hypothetical protein
MPRVTRKCFMKVKICFRKFFLSVLYENSVSASLCLWTSVPSVTIVVIIFIFGSCQATPKNNLFFESKDVLLINFNTS